MLWDLYPRARTDAGWRELGEDGSLSLTCLTYILLLLSRKQEKVIWQKHGSFWGLLFLVGCLLLLLSYTQNIELCCTVHMSYFPGGINFLFFLFFLDLSYSILLILVCGVFPPTLGRFKKDEIHKCSLTALQRMSKTGRWPVSINPPYRIFMSCLYSMAGHKLFLK